MKTSEEILKEARQNLKKTCKRIKAWHDDY